MIQSGQGRGITITSFLLPGTFIVGIATKKQPIGIITKDTNFPATLKQFAENAIGEEKKNAECSVSLQNSADHAAKSIQTRKDIALEK
jgi:hypothetical protein